MNWILWTNFSSSAGGGANRPNQGEREKRGDDMGLQQSHEQEEDSQRPSQGWTVETVDLYQICTDLNRGIWGQLQL